jgi:hypothetical protein
MPWNKFVNGITGVSDIVDWHKRQSTRAKKVVKESYILFTSFQTVIFSFQSPNFIIYVKKQVESRIYVYDFQE